MRLLREPNPSPESARRTGAGTLRGTDGTPRGVTRARRGLTRALRWAATVLAVAAASPLLSRAHAAPHAAPPAARASVAVQDPAPLGEPALAPRPDAAPTAEIARIPVTIVQGRLVVACQLGAKKRIACNLFVDLDTPVGLLLHNKAADGIEAEGDDGKPNPITIFLPDVNVGVEQREVGEEKPYDEFTKWWSKELGENAVVGTIGAKVLARYHVTLDLPAGFLELSAPHAREAEATTTPTTNAAGTLVTPATIVNDVVWAKVGFGDRRSGALGLATSRYDSWVDSDLAFELGHPAGDVGPVRLGEFDLGTFVAFRPEEVRHVHPDGVFGLTGVNLLAHFRVEIDRVNARVSWTRVRPAAFPTADLEYFRARVDGTSAALEGWLDAHPNERLSSEAANRLVTQFVREGVAGTRMKTAMERVQATTPADLKATGALTLLNAMLAAGKPEYALAAGELGVAHGRQDRYPDAIHKIHARMGDVLLERGEREEAWKHLLSAAFGLPEDGPLNLSLGRYYEAEGRHARAFSRYLAALLSADSGPQAIEGLQRVQDKVPDTEAFSVDSIERLIAGRVQGYGVASRFQPKEGRTYTRTVLAELYTNAHARGEIGVTLARDGLRDFFARDEARAASTGDDTAGTGAAGTPESGSTPPAKLDPEQLGPVTTPDLDHLVLVTYHVPEPEMDPLVNRLALHQWRTYGGLAEAAHWIDATVEVPPAGLVRHKEQIFDATRKAVIARLDEDSEHLLEITANADRDGLRGSVVVRGPAETDLIVQILLVERGVLFPGKSTVVVHHDVARAALTTDVAGVSYEPAGGSMTIPFERTWATIAQENEAFLAERESEGGARVPRFSTRVDPRQARVVVILRAQDGGAVMQCARFDPVLSEELR